MKKIIFLVFIIGFVTNILSVLPSNITIGFDQVRDLFTATTIIRDHDIKIIGPTAGNNPNLHHGVLFWYSLIPGLILFRGNPAGAAVFNGFLNALGAVVIYLLAKDIFKSNKTGAIAGIIAAVSFYYTQFSGWLSNPTGTFFTLPVFFYGLWKYYEKKNWGMLLAAFFLGLTIQFELFFIYLIPTTLILFFALKMKPPPLKTIIYSLILFSLATSTMIATEIKFHFAGIKSIFFAGQLVGNGRNQLVNDLLTFMGNRWETFYLNFWPQNHDAGTLIGILAIGFLIFETAKLWKNKIIRHRNIFVLTWFLSPAIMLILGVHNAPWFYIGRPAAAILIGAYLISKIKPRILSYSLVVLIILANLLAIKDSYGKGQILLEPDPSSLMSDHLKAVDYTYNSSNNSPFEINTLTNPLYINAIWSYHYLWYGQKTYGFLPSWAGGDQLYPYDTLPKPNGKEKFLYLIMDTSFRIPPQYRNNLLNWADKISILKDEKKFGGIDVQKRIIISKK